MKLIFITIILIISTFLNVKAQIINSIEIIPNILTSESTNKLICDVTLDMLPTEPQFT